MEDRRGRISNGNNNNNNGGTGTTQEVQRPRPSSHVQIANKEVPSTAVRRPTVHGPQTHHCHRHCCRDTGADAITDAIAHTQNRRDAHYGERHGSTLTPLHTNTHTQNRRDAHYGERHGSTEQRAKTKNQCTFKPCARQCLEGPHTQTLQLDFADASSAQLVPN